MAEFKFSKVLSLLFSLVLIVSACGDDEPGSDSMAVTPKVSVQELSFEEGEDDTKAFVRVRLNTATEELVTVYVSSIDGTAEGDVDYLAFKDVPIVFAPGDKNKDFQITLFGDEEAEADEDFDFTISRVEGNVEIDNGTAKVTIVNDDRELTDVVIPTAGFSSPESYAGMNLIWQDEFNTLNTDFWTFEIGRGNSGWGNDELQYYQRQNTTIVDGHMVIEAREEDVGNQYTSSRIITENKFDFKFGRVDIRAALPKGQGIWPALWMLGTNIRTAGWPACGEIDIMEVVGHQASTLYGTAHWSNNGQKADFGGSTNLPSGTFNDQFHVFSIIWTENRIQWFLNDVKYHELNTSSAAMDEFRKNQFFIFNIAVGGRWPGNPNASTEFPQRMVVDYIRVFQDQ